uniref:Uncharacterized protein n=1 Tax=Ditylenchus dipsaci TaxID=166011 RepID=A0A915EB43_9BILA
MPTTINRLFHRLNNSRRSFSVSSAAKKKKSSSPPPAALPSTTNNRLDIPLLVLFPKCSSSLTSGSQYDPENHPKLSAHSSPILSHIFGSSNVSLNYIEDPFELCRLKRVSSGVHKYVRRRMDRVTHMDVSKVKFSDSTCSQISRCASSIVLDHNQWYAHPSGDYKVLMRLVPLNTYTQQLQEEDRQEEYRVELMVDNSWTSRDISLLCSVLLNVFRQNLKIIHVDAPIVELIIASLSIIDLDRWYAFQCFMKAVNDHQMHLAINHLPANPSSDPKDLYWPKVETLVIRSTERQSAHLARLLDYGVRSQLVMDRRKLDMLKIELTGVKTMNKDLKRNLYHFRCWAGSAGFDDRFSQHYSVNVV